MSSGRVAPVREDIAVLMDMEPVLTRFETFDPALNDELIAMLSQH